MGNKITLSRQVYNQSSPLLCSPCKGTDTLPFVQQVGFGYYAFFWELCFFIITEKRSMFSY